MVIKSIKQKKYEKSSMQVYQYESGFSSPEAGLEEEI